MTTLTLKEAALAKLDKEELALQESLAAMAERRRLAGYLPNDPAAPFRLGGMGLGGWLAPVQLTVEVQSREEALELLAVLPALDKVLLQGSTFTFSPLETVDKVTEGESHYKQTEVAPVHVRIDQYREEIIWFTRLDDKLAQVVARVSSSSVRAFAQVADRSTGRAIWVFGGMPEGKLMNVGSCSPDYSGTVIAYWPREADFKSLMLKCQSYTRRTAS